MTERIITIDQLVARLHKPMYVLQMARPGEHRKDAMGKSCRRRAQAARVEIDLLVRAYLHGERI